MSQQQPQQQQQAASRSAASPLSPHCPGQAAGGVVSSTYLGVQAGREAPFRYTQSISIAAPEQDNYASAFRENPYARVSVRRGISCAKHTLIESFL